MQHVSGGDHGVEWAQALGLVGCGERGQRGGCVGRGDRVDDSRPVGRHPAQRFQGVVRLLVQLAHDRLRHRCRGVCMEAAVLPPLLRGTGDEVGQVLLQQGRTVRIPLDGIGIGPGDSDSAQLGGDAAGERRGDASLARRGCHRHVNVEPADQPDPTAGHTRVEVGGELLGGIPRAEPADPRVRQSAGSLGDAPRQLVPTDVQRVPRRHRDSRRRGG